MTAVSAQPVFGTPPATHSVGRGRRMITMRMLPEKGIHYSPNHLRSMWNRGTFPAPVRLSPRRLAWTEEAIDRWIAAKVAEQEV